MTSPAPSPAAADERDQYIPLRKTDIIETLLSDDRLDAVERDDFTRLCRILSSVFHYEFHEQLETLKDSYFFFQPEHGGLERLSGEARSQAYNRLVTAFETVMRAANFVEVSREEIDQAERDEALLRVKTRTPTDDFETVRFFRRGRHREQGKRPRWHGFGGTDVEYDVYDNVIVFIGLKIENAPAHRRRFIGARAAPTKPGSVLIKYFCDMPRADLNMLYPNVRVVMSLEDQLMLGVPAIAGGIPILINLIPALSVLFLVLGAYLGVAGAVEGDQLKQALAAMSGLVALGGFLWRQWSSYERRSLRYQRELTEHIYFRNINNNAGIFDYVIGAAEEQETKESFLAYFMLHTAKSPMTHTQIDQAVEDWLKAKFALDIDFEIGDALGKLERLRLLRRTGDTFTVVSLKEALALLDEQWDQFYNYVSPSQVPTPAS